MTYVKQTWKNGVAGGTPISATRLAHMEDGIENATVPEGTYVPADPVISIAYDGDNIATVVENGVTTTFTYNIDGTIATSTRLGVTRTYSYTDGSLVGVA